MVKCCGFVEFRHELGKKTQQKWKFAENLVQNEEFFIIWRFPIPDEELCPSLVYIISFLRNVD
jgi:hypothetical protein